MATRELFRRLTLDEIYGERRVSKTQPGEWEYPAPLIGEFATTLPTPLQSENDVLGTTAGAITMLKQWDLSPVDQSSFDPTEPPGRPGPPPPVNTTPPFVTGTPQVNQTLTTTAGVWDNNPQSAAYQWLRNGTNRPASTAATVTLTTADLGAQMSCRVTATSPAGSGVATSNVVGPVLPLAPTITAAPVVTAPNGTIVGQSVQTTNGTWANTATSYTIAWLRGGTVIGGASNNLYTLGALDDGAMISSRVTASNAGGASAPSTSNTVGPVTTTASDEPGDEPAPQPTRPTRTRR